MSRAPFVDLEEGTGFLAFTPPVTRDGIDHPWDLIRAVATHQKLSHGARVATFSLVYTAPVMKTILSNRKNP